MRVLQPTVDRLLDVLVVRDDSRRWGYSTLEAGSPGLQNELRTETPGSNLGFPSPLGLQGLYAPFPGVLVVNLSQNSSMISCGVCCLLFFGGGRLAGFSAAAALLGPGSIPYSSGGNTTDMMDLVLVAHSGLYITIDWSSDAPVNV